MDIDKNTIIGLLLIGLVIAFTYSDFYKRLVFQGEVPPPPTQQKLVQEEPEAASKSIQEIQTPEAKSPVRKGKSIDKKEFLKQSIIQDFNLQVPEAEERRITIDTPLYTGVISSKGPSVQEWTLKKYFGPDSLPFQMVLEKYGNISLSFPIQGDTLYLQDFIFEYTGFSDRIELNESNPTAEIGFRLRLAEDKVIEQTLRFYYDKYSFDMKVHISGLKDIVDGFNYGVNWAGGLRNSEANIVEDMNYSKAYALTAEDIEEFDLKGKDSAVGGADDWIIRWGAIRTKYFTAAIIPTSQTGNGIKFVGEKFVLAPERFLKKYSIELRMPYVRQRTEDDFIVYIGPLEYYTVKSYGVQLERMMNFGWKIIRPISKLVLWSLVHLYSIIPNYGLVIIIFSILVKIVLYPLTKKSYQSMKEMQKLQPELEKLREKYKDDPQKLSAETMQLYREYGINPLGGCLPVILQMPLLYALFIVFRSTIELRGAPFFGWIKDLSAPDTVFTLPFSIPLYGSGVNVLPIVMGATMLWQQKMTMKDPKQKMLVYMMPIFFTLIFNNFPSGLTLYYTLFNVFSIIQQKFIPDDSHGEPGKPLPKKKRSRRPKSRIEMMRQLRGR